MRPRDPDEPGRTASSLELFFDLVFVIAVSIAAAQLHDGLTEAHVGSSLFAYGVVFFGIWWAWMNFTWFASSFATDDWLYRVLTIVQMSGVLVLASGIEPTFADRDYTGSVLGYVVMRVAMVAQWLRASRSAGPSRHATQTYAGGIALLQVFWLLLLALSGPAATIALIVLIAAEVAIPLVAEQHGRRRWHAHHITERYGLFTLIVLGEGLLSSANAIIEAHREHEALGSLISISISALIVTAALWWIYFWPPHHEAISSFASSFRYGYVHYFVFAAAGAFSVGVEIKVDVSTHHSKLSDLAAAVSVSVPIALFVLGIWWIALREQADRTINTVVPVGALLVLLDPIAPASLAVSAAILTLVVVALVLRPPRPTRRPARRGSP